MQFSESAGNEDRNISNDYQIGNQKEKFYKETRAQDSFSFFLRKSWCPTEGEVHLAYL